MSSSSTPNSSPSMPVSPTAGKGAGTMHRGWPALGGTPAAEGASVTGHAPSLFSPLRSSNAEPCHVSRVVQAMSRLHRSSPFAAMRATFFTPRHFPKVLGVAIFWAGIAGFVGTDVGRKQKLETQRQKYYEAYHGDYRAARLKADVSIANRHFLQRKEMMKNW